MLSEKINQSTAYTTKMRESVTNVVQQIEQYEESGLSTGLIDALCTVLSQQNNSEIHNHDESISNAAERGLAIIVRRSDNIDESLQDSSIWKTTAHVLNREDVDRHTKENLLSSIGLIGIQLEFASKQGMNSAQGINELKESIHTFVSKKDENVKYGVAQRKAESLLKSNLKELTLKLHTINNTKRIL
ncbi:MAG: hypothetical protein EZS28_008795 [Streblomastix strix]|uniref:Uncharacterized protein n=1 Tax=Streblomastix strix TaxID=222440 RepID=A0A5J4WLG0_9EUKA|nr:MAG: hypothetical protein EZS28_008795 [Streblomastix strix]